MIRGRLIVIKGVEHFLSQGERSTSIALAGWISWEHRCGADVPTGPFEVSPIGSVEYAVTRRGVDFGNQGFGLSFLEPIDITGDAWVERT